MKDCAPDFGCPLVETLAWETLSRLSLVDVQDAGRIDAIFEGNFAGGLQEIVLPVAVLPIEDDAFNGSLKFSIRGGLLMLGPDIEASLDCFS